MTYDFEEMSDQHRNSVIDIYNHHVLSSFAAYPAEPVSYDSFDRFTEMSRGYPSLVVKENTGGIVGFGFLHPYHLAKTFNSTVETTYFLMPGHTQKGVGTALLSKLIQGAKKQGIRSILANISSHNEPSLRFHLKNGFRECGRFRKVGRKFEEDFDVVWMQLFLSQ